jgi:hypothetical protein
VNAGTFFTIYHKPIAAASLHLQPVWTARPLPRQGTLTSRSIKICNQLTYFSILSNTFRSLWPINLRQENHLCKKYHYHTKTAVVHIADVLICTSEISNSGESFVPLIQKIVWDRLKLNERLLAEFVDEIEDKLVEVKKFSLHMMDDWCWRQSELQFLCTAPASRYSG